MWPHFLRKRIKALLDSLKLSNKTLGVTFVNDTAIKKLNRQYRQKDKATDVLSFPMDDDLLLGDIVISVDTAKRQAKELKRTLHSQSLFLIIHGLLHLIGYDHINDSDWKKMKVKEDELWTLMLKLDKRHALRNLKKTTKVK